MKMEGEGILSIHIVVLVCISLEEMLCGLGPAEPGGGGGGKDLPFLPVLTDLL